MQEIINDMIKNGITRKVWDALVKKARATKAGKATFNMFPSLHHCNRYSVNHFEMGYEHYCKHADTFFQDKIGDDTLVAKLLNVSQPVVSRWHRLCDTAPVYSCFASQVSAVLGTLTNVQSETAAATTVNTIKLKTISHAFSSELDNDMQRLQKLTDAYKKIGADLETLTADIENKKRAKQNEARELINQIAAEAGLIATVNTF